jgi:polyisoprenoid-binding protein YceI
MLRSRIWIALFAAGLGAGCTEATAPPAAPTAPATGDVSAPAGGFAAAPEGPGKKFSLDNGKIEFTGSKPDGKHEGGFNEFVGYALLGEGDTIESITVDINTESLWADDKKLAGHLMHHDFFDVKVHPKATFVSTSIEPATGGTHTVKGNLTLHGVTKPIEFPATIAKNGGNVDFNADFEISRKEFDMNFKPEAIHDPVKIKTSFSVPAN